MADIKQKCCHLLMLWENLRQKRQPLNYTLFQNMDIKKTARQLPGSL
jgi:hypothetical protein